MSRYGPQVLPIAGPTLADALVQGVGAFMSQRDRMRKQSREDSAEVRAGNADARAEALLGIQQSQEGRAVEADQYDRTYVRPIEQAKRATDAYDRGVDIQTDDQMIAGNIAVDGTSRYSVNPDRTATGDAKAARDAQAERDRQNRIANALIQKDKIESNERIAGVKARTAVTVQGMKGTVAERVAKVRAAGGGRATNEALKQAQDEAAVSASMLARAQKAFEESGNDPALMPQLQEAQERAEFDEGVYDVLLRDAAPAVVLPDRRQPAPAPSPFIQGITPGVSGMPQGMPRAAAPAPAAFPQGVKGPVTPAAPAPAAVPVGPTQTRLSREQIDAMRSNALKAGRDPVGVENRYRQLLKANGYR